MHHQSCFVSIHCHHSQASRKTQNARTQRTNIAHLYPEIKTTSIPQRHCPSLSSKRSTFLADVVARQYHEVPPNHNHPHHSFPPSLVYKFPSTKCIVFADCRSILQALELASKIIFVQVAVLNLLGHFSLTLSCFLCILEL